MNNIAARLKAKFPLGWLLSSLLHLVIIFSIVPIFNFSFAKQSREIKATKVQANIEVTLVPDFFANKLSDDKTQSKKIESVQQLSKSEDNSISKMQETALVNAVQANQNSSPKPKRYEQILARHFAHALPKNSQNVQKDRMVNLWIRINREGKIIDHGFLPDVKDAQLDSILKQMIAQANPVPLPPQDEFTKEYAQYMIPILLRK